MRPDREETKVIVRDKNERCAQCGAVNRTHGRPCIDAAPTLIHDYADLLDDAPDMYIRAYGAGVEAAIRALEDERSKHFVGTSNYAMVSECMQLVAMLLPEKCS